MKLETGETRIFSGERFLMAFDYLFIYFNDETKIIIRLYIISHPIASDNVQDNKSSAEYYMNDVKEHLLQKKKKNTSETINDKYYYYTYFTFKKEKILNERKKRRRKTIDKEIQNQIHA